MESAQEGLEDLRRAFYGAHSSTSSHIHAAAEFGFCAVVYHGGLNKVIRAWLVRGLGIMDGVFTISCVDHEVRVVVALSANF